MQLGAFAGCERIKSTRRERGAYLDEAVVLGIVDGAELGGSLAAGGVALEDTTATLTLTYSSDNEPERQQVSATLQHAIGNTQKNKQKRQLNAHKKRRAKKTRQRSASCAKLASSGRATAALHARWRPS